MLAGSASVDFMWRIGSSFYIMFFCSSYFVSMRIEKVELARLIHLLNRTQSI